MDTLARLMETGQLRVVVDRTFPLSQAPQAMQHLMSGQPLGRVVIRIDA
jgi:NADPH:quinone reductase-like Zn-dependent oxidoreductase